MVVKGISNQFSSIEQVTDQFLGSGIRKKEIQPDISFEQILADLRERDYKDEHRKVAPLRKAKDSIVIDSSEISLEETIQKCIEVINLKMQK